MSWFVLNQMAQNIQFEHNSHCPGMICEVCKLFRAVFLFKFLFTTFLTAVIFVVRTNLTAVHFVLMQYEILLFVSFFFPHLRKVRATRTVRGGVAFLLFIYISLILTLFPYSCHSFFIRN